VIARLAEQPRGLVLVTGPTGSGTTTTLAAMIDHVDSARCGCRWPPPCAASSASAWSTGPATA
jgi:hypothetical protein